MKNIYTSLKEFEYEYMVGREFSWQNNEKRERFMGIEFKYDNGYYRMCREPFDEEHPPVLKNGKRGVYHMMVMHCEKSGYPNVEQFETIGWFASLETLLSDCYLKNRQFKEIIIDPDTEILSQD